MLVVGKTSVNVVSVVYLHAPVVPACRSVVDLSVCVVVLWPCLCVLLCCDLVCV